MFQGLLASKGSINPEELQMLHGMLQHWCETNKVDSTSWQATDAAARMISLFQGCGGNEARFRALMENFN